MEGPRTIDLYQKPKHKLRSTNGLHFSALCSKSGHVRVKIGNQKNNKKDGSEPKQVPTTTPTADRCFPSDPEQSRTKHRFISKAPGLGTKNMETLFLQVSGIPSFSGPRTWNRMVKWRSWKTLERWDWMRLVCKYFPSVFNEMFGC